MTSSAGSQLNSFPVSNRPPFRPRHFELNHSHSSRLEFNVCHTTEICFFNHHVEPPFGRDICVSISAQLNLGEQDELLRGKSIDAINT